MCYFEKMISYISTKPFSNIRWKMTVISGNMVPLASLLRKHHGRNGLIDHFINVIIIEYGAKRGIDICYHLAVMENNKFYSDLLKRRGGEPKIFSWAN